MNNFFYASNQLMVTFRIQKERFYYKKLQEKIPAKELTTVMRGIYFDFEVWDVIEEQSQKLGCGGKSKLVNETVKNYLQRNQ